MTVLAATAWRTNAEMIVDVVNLGYIQPDDDVIDLTYGRGIWWKKYRPASFVANANDLDYRALPAEWTNKFDVVVFDPPYVAMGGRETSGLPDFMDRFGLKTAPKTPAELHQYNVDGLREAYRICRPRGFVMTKCADYISSGRLQLASHWMLQDALDIGFEVHDKLTHIGNVRPQPPGRRTVHARQNTSTLWVFRTPRRKTT